MFLTLFASSNSIALAHPRYLATLKRSLLALRPRAAPAFFWAAISCLIFSATTPAAAEDAWPTRTVTFIVASAPGGATDLYARLIADYLAKSLKQTFIVENRAGGGGNLGAGLVAHASPDGYIFLVAGTQSLVINPSLFKDLPYDAEKDLTPVARGVMSPMVLVSHPSLPAQSLQELIALGKNKPNSVPFGSAGYGSTTYLGVKMLEEMSNASFVHVPFKGLGQAFQTLLTGDIKFIYADVGTALPMIHSGAVHALAVTQTTSQLPATPTVADAGFPEAEVIGTFSVAAPAGTPGYITHRLSGAVNDAMRDPDVAAKLNAHALIPVFDTPESYSRVLQEEREKWSRFIQRNGISVDKD
jgi:tripartite-type tricarboxylate transporter receptor subunit TctC